MGDISHKPAGGRLPLLSTGPAVTFRAKEITPFDQYQIMLLGDRGTQVSSHNSNPRPVNHKSDAIPIVPPHHHSTSIIFYQINSVMPCGWDGNHKSGIACIMDLVAYLSMGSVA